MEEGLTEKMAHMCLCRDCPSFRTKSDQTLFCVNGKIGGRIDHKGCICKMCSIYEMKGLRWSYYCIFTLKNDFRKIDSRDSNVGRRSQVKS